MKNYFGGVFAGDKNQNMLKISFKGDAKITILRGLLHREAYLTDKPKNYENHWINCEKQIKNSFQAAAGDIKGGQARPRTKIEPSMANQILLPPPGWSLLNREAWCFRAAMLFQPSWQHDNQFSSETNTARISFQECSDHVSVSLASYPVYGKLCMYWWSYASTRLYIECF